VSLAYIGLGSNLDQPRAQVEQALSELEALPDTRIIKQSALFQSAPVGPQDQPDYINAAALLETGLAPEALLNALQAIELMHGRERIVHWGARTLDLDILLYDQQRITTERLTVPHAHLHERSFVLGPLLDINDALTLPSGESVASLWQQCDKTGLSRLES